MSGALWDDPIAPPAAPDLIVEADGGSRGNPGIAAGGAVVLDATTGELIVELGVYVGMASNNVAEYRGMIEGLRAAFERDPASVRVRLDSKLVVEQMTGRWKIKHPDMQSLAREARELIAGRQRELRVDPASAECESGCRGQRIHGPSRELSPRPRRLSSLGRPARGGEASADRLAARVGRLDGRVTRVFSRAEERPGSTGQGGG